MSNLTMKLLAVVVAALALAGCVSEQISPEYKPRMGVAQSADGYVYFTIDTRVGYRYAIYYDDKQENRWVPVPGCDNIRGTGEEVQLKKKFNPRMELPAFTLRHVRIK